MAYDADTKAQKPNKHVPDGYKDQEEFLAEMRQRWEDGTDADRENRDMALEDFKFLSGEQWDPAVKAKRLEAFLPCLTINTLPQHVGQVVGDIRINKPSIRVRPAEDGDKKVAEVRQGLIRFIENQSHAQSVYALAGEDQVGGGIGHFRIGLEYAKGDTFDQDIKIKHIPNPFAVLWDAQSQDPTGKDARFCFVVDEMDRASFTAAYPDSMVTTLEVPLNVSSWTSSESVRVTEYWVMKPKERTLAVLLRPPAVQPSIEDITDTPDDVQFAVKDAMGKPRVRKTQRYFACMYLTNGHELLEDPYEIAISRVPIFKVTGREIRVGTKRYRFGIVRFAKDPSRMKNSWRSAAAQWIGQAPKLQYFINTSDEEEADALRASAKSGETVMSYTGANAPTRLDPPTAPNALLQEAALADQDIKDVTGLHDASLGMQSNETSGKAILAREKQGDVATFMYHDNLHYAIQECGTVANEMIDIAFDKARTAVVLGEDGSSTPTRVNDPTAEEHVDLKLGKYDVALEVGPSYSTKRAESAESMLAFVQAVPAAAAVTGDLIASAQDWPMADAFAERLKKALPPQFQEDDPEDMTPEQQQAKQQAMQAAQEQQQMQEQAGKLALAKGDAEVGLLHAQVEKTKAEADNVGATKGSGETPLDVAIKEAALAKARADARAAEANADKAEAEAAKARYEIPHAEATAEREHVALASDIEDLKNKPLERQHSEADLDLKLNPPEPETAKA